MKLFKKIKIKFVDGSVIRRIFIFEKPVFDIIKNNRKLKIKLANQDKPKSKDQSIFYLKVNRIHKTSFDCLQHWMAVANKMPGGAFCYIVCDNKKFEYSMYENPCYFYPGSFKVIKSDRKQLNNEVSRLFSGTERSGLWQRIALSMMTPFVHADKNGFTKSYNIDADDIMILARPEYIASALTKMEKYASDNDYDSVNLDMFVSKSFGVHWSFGLVFMKNPAKCLKAFKENIEWKNDLERISRYKIAYVNDFNYNVDWLFTFLRDSHQLKLSTFAIKNALVIHMPDIAISRHWAFVFQWKTDKIYFPIIHKLYGDSKWANLPLAGSVKLIDANLGVNEYMNFVNIFYWTDYGFENSMLSIARDRNLVSECQYKYYYSKPKQRW